jgi:hypothetical protein
MFDDEIKCENCEFELESESEIFPYEETNLCQLCYDEQKRLDEIDVQEWETEGLNDYE